MEREVKELLVTDGAIVTREDGFVRLRRRAAPPISDVTEIEAFAAQFGRAVPLRERAKLGLLMDVRDGPLGTDDEIARRMEPALRQVRQGFARLAVLVGTAVGKLQANRRTREVSGNASRVFDSEGAAIAYVRGEEPPSGRA
jgi:hypothetical protein